MNSRETEVLIVGAGAAGLLAAVNSACTGAKTLVVERNKWPGIKLSITGKGKCNITNTADIDDFIKNFGHNGRSLKSVFYQFFNNDLIELFNEAGIPSKAERGGRVFPVHEDSRELVHRLSMYASGKGVKFLYNSRISTLLTENNKVTGAKLEDGSIIHARAVVIATGGISYPATGSTGDGYELAFCAGHSIVKALPALVPLETHEKFPVSMNNLILNNIVLNIWKEQKKTGSLSGEMKFRDYGIDGPVVLSLSRLIAEDIDSGAKVRITLDLKPAIDHPVLDQRLLKEIQESKVSVTGKMMETLLPSGMISWFLRIAGVSFEKKCNELTAEDRKKIRLNLKNLPLEIIAARPFSEAIITRGGVNIKEIDFKTMQSRLINNLFFAGEVIDIDAETGGYNLQAAFSTGWVAGKFAALA